MALLRGLRAPLARQVRHKAVWQPTDTNVGEDYNQPISRVVMPAWQRAKARNPVPMGLHKSKADVRYDLDFNFPDHALVLEIHSVLYPTQLVVFRVTPKLSENEIELYLRNVYGIDTVKEINLQYRRGDRFMDAFGRRWKHPDYNRAYVYLTKAVEIDLKAQVDVQ
eukprot:TRINITY_DN15327_c0_g1_i1.p1 TRINITY_DN15327_c0_g1~~TRINITY_DN15327_c0_g1_i1.p1  ORF type:complete len:166 (+),score=65.20 TRINITY_DN15327_c0_g1_i1:49-546(+)